MRKIAGAHREHIVLQFLGESFAFSLTAVILALIFVVFLLPLFSSVIGRELQLNLHFILPVSFGLALFTSLAAGSYPAALPYFNWHQTGFDWETKDPSKKISVCFNSIDYDFVETLKINIIEGRSFSREYPSDAYTNFLINEEMVKLLAKESAVGATLIHGDEPGKIVGVIENFHFQSYRHHIEPLVLKLEPTHVDNILIRIPPENISSSLKFIRQT